MKKRRLSVLQLWEEHKKGNCSRTLVERELNTYNRMLLASYVVGFVLYYGLFIFFENWFFEFTWVDWLSALVIGGVSGIIIMLVLYQYRRLEIKDDESIKDKEF